VEHVNTLPDSVLDQVGAALDEMGVRAERRIGFDWITNRVPAEDDMGIPPRVKYRLIRLHEQLGGEWSRLENKRRRPLYFDFSIDSSTLLEIDHKHQFTSERLLTLSFYEGLDHHLNLDEYRRVCEEYRDQADSYKRSSEAVDFPFSGGRRAQRAYFNVVQDLLAPAFGYRLVRLPAPENEMTENLSLALRVLL
jgi:hypothetical protein